MNLSSTQIKDTYGNLLTIGSVAGTPTTGTLQNGAGSDITSITLNGGAVFNEGGGNFDFRVEGQSAPNLLFVDASTARVGIGTNAPAEFVSIQPANTVVPILRITPGSGASGGFSRATIQLYDQTESAGYQIRNTGDGGNSLTFLSVSGGTATARVDFTSAGNVGIGTTSPAVKLDVSGQVRASTGILFGTDTAAANALDDYEEGTWTPIYEPATGTFTTMTMDVPKATYTKIGNQVTFFGFFRTDDVDLTGGSGALRVGGLPYQPAATTFMPVVIGNAVNFVAGDFPIGGYVLAGTDQFVLIERDAVDGATIPCLVNSLTTGATADQNILYVSGVYFV